MLTSILPVPVPGCPPPPPMVRSQGHGLQHAPCSKVPVLVQRWRQAKSSEIRWHCAPGPKPTIRHTTNWKMTRNARGHHDHPFVRISSVVRCLGAHSFLNQTLVCSQPLSKRITGSYLRENIATRVKSLHFCCRRRRIPVQDHGPACKRMIHALCRPTRGGQPRPTADSNILRLVSIICRRVPTRGLAWRG